jgi:formate hydrogenlyase subunit 6/NADH:ubiquinone oxidoreductase subunit I
MNLKIGAMLPEVIRQLFKKPATVQYPFERNKVPATLRGKPVMNPGLCVGCKMCERDCPSEAITIQKVSETTDEQGKVKRNFSMTFYLDRCTHCAQCEESCAKRAITMDNCFEDAAFNRDSLKIIYR